MLFSRSTTKTAKRDLRRLLASRNEEDAALVEEAFGLLEGMLRFDPHLQGVAAKTTGQRVVTCGPIRVSYRVFPLDDRLVEINGVAANVD